MTKEKFKYDYLRYNVHGVLRPNWQLKLSLVFLCRHILMLILIGGMSFKGGQKGGTELLVELLNPVYNITDLLPLLLLLVMGLRNPKANIVPRWIWKQGRWLMLFSIALFLTILGFRTQLALSTYGAVEWAMIAANGLIAFYIATSPYIRDLFNEFPPPNSDRNGLLATGKDMMRTGKLDEAEQVFRRILENEPDEPDALHLLGLVRFQNGHHEEAVTFIKQAIAHARPNEDYLNNLGQIYKLTGRLAEASESFRQALEIKPDYIEAHINLGTTLKDLDRIEDAAESFRKVLDLKPDFAEAHFNLAVALHEMGQIEESVASYRKAIAIKPDFPQAFCNLGNTLKELGLLEDAAANLQKFIASWPDLAEAEVHVNLGITLKDLGRFEDAVLSYRKALVLKPDFAEVHLNIGNVFHEQGRLEDALACYQKANTINPGFVETYRNLGIVYQKLGRQEDAVTSFKKALEIRPDYAEAHRNLGQTFRKQGRMEEAKKSYARALEINPGLDDVSHSLSALSGETTEKAPESYVRKLFDSYAKGFDDHLANKLGYKIPALMRKSVDGVTDVQETFQRALDLGCGTGLVAESFLDRIKKIDGVDLSPKMLEQAETKAVYNTLYRQDLLEFLEGPEIQESEYDLVLSADTFIYVGRLDQIFAAVGRALKDGGLFVFSVEQLDKGDYKLLSSGRYSQSNAYITNLATDYEFSIVICDPVVIRTENNQPIPGNIFILRAAT